MMASNRSVGYLTILSTIANGLVQRIERYVLRRKAYEQ